MFKLLMDYPSREEENEILGHYAEGRDPRQLDSFDVTSVMRAGEVGEVRQAVSKVIVEPKLIAYITDIVSKSREWHSVSVGASPRGSVNIFLAARTLAACRGRDFVVPDDVKEIAPWVLRHRLRLRPEAEIEGVTPDDVIRQILEGVEVPRS
jgi:MoxR-like ATPase